MSGKKKTRKSVHKISPNQYRIYGIFDFQEEKLIYINLNLEETEFEFDITDYDSKRYSIVKFDVMLV